MEIIKTLDGIDFTSFDTFYNSVNGKAYNLNGENPNGAQCWAGVLLLYRHLGQKLSSGGSEHAKDGWLDKQARRQNSGKNFTKITKIEDVQRGDVVFFDDGESGHVAYACGVYDKESMMITIFGQNQNQVSDTKGSPFSVVEYPTDGFLGAYRCEKWMTEADKIDELGTGETLQEPSVVCSQPPLLISPFRSGDLVRIEISRKPVWYSTYPDEIKSVDEAELVKSNVHKVIAYRGTAVMLSTVLTRNTLRRSKYPTTHTVERPIESKYLKHELDTGEQLNLPVHRSPDEPPIFFISDTKKVDLVNNYAIFARLKNGNHLFINNSKYWKMLTGKRTKSSADGVVFGSHSNGSVDPANIIGNDYPQDLKLENPLTSPPIWGKYNHNGHLLYVQLNNHKTLLK